jgi:hypothetical protein
MMVILGGIINQFKMQKVGADLRPHKSESPQLYVEGLPNTADLSAAYLAPRFQLFAPFSISTCALKSSSP